MTNAELLAKIKAEIERRIKIQDDWAGRKVLPGRDLAFAVKEELKQLLSFLDTLESEAKEEKKVPTRIYLGSRYEFIRKDILLNEIERLKNNNEVSDDKEYASYELDVACGYDMACNDIFSFLKPFAEVDKHPKNILAPSKECEPGLREPLEESKKPMNQDGLEEEFNHYCFDFKDPDTGEDIPRNQISFNVEDALNVARHFAKWGAEHLATSGKTLEIKPGDEVTINGHKVAYDKDKDAITMEAIPNDLEEAAVKWSKENTRGFVLKDKTTRYVGDTIDAFIAGAKWQESHTPLHEDTVLFNKGVEEGKRLMMEEAVEGEVMLNPYPTICLDDCKDYDFKDGDKVRVIVLHKED